MNAVAAVRARTTEGIDGRPCMWVTCPASRRPSQPSRLSSARGVLYDERGVWLWGGHDRTVARGYWCSFLKLETCLRPQQRRSKWTPALKK